MRHGSAIAALALLAVPFAASESARAETPADVPGELASQVAALFQLDGPEDAETLAVLRCMGGKVMACYVGANLPCGKIDQSRDNAAVSSYCREQPGAEVPAVVSGHDTLFQWRCEGDKAEAGEAIWQLDARGFASQLWKPVP